MLCSVQVIFDCDRQGPDILERILHLLTEVRKEQPETEQSPVIIDHMALAKVPISRRIASIGQPLFEREL